MNFHSIQALHIWIESRSPWNHNGDPYSALSQFPPYKARSSAETTVDSKPEKLNANKANMHGGDSHLGTGNVKFAYGLSKFSLKPQAMIYGLVRICTICNQDVPVQAICLIQQALQLWRQIIRAAFIGDHKQKHFDRISMIDVRPELIRS